MNQLSFFRLSWLIWSNRDRLLLDRKIYWIQLHQRSPSVLWLAWSGLSQVGPVSMDSCGNPGVVIIQIPLLIKLGWIDYSRITQEYTSLRGILDVNISTHGESLGLSHQNSFSIIWSELDFIASWWGGFALLVPWSVPTSPSWKRSTTSGGDIKCPNNRQNGRRSLCSKPVWCFIIGRQGLLRRPQNHASKTIHQT